MRLFLAGCEYSGTTTLAVAVRSWAQRTLGVSLPIHDHWKLPLCSGHPPYETITNLTDMEQEQVLALTPRLKEIFTRYTTYYHTPSVCDGSGAILVGHYLEDMVYSQLYFAYGGEGEPGDRQAVKRDIEQQLLEYAPETVLVLVKASPAVIERRMKESPHVRGVLQERDVDRVLLEFESLFESSLLPNKLTIDTTAATVDESVAELVEGVRPYLTQSDRLRILTRSI